MPHIWQLTHSLLNAPSSYTFNSDALPSSPWLHSSLRITQSLVVTMELHVQQDLANYDMLKLTKWAWEQCVNALHFWTQRGAGDGHLLPMVIVNLSM
jgi:hypothetical protein